MKEYVRNEPNYNETIDIYKESEFTQTEIAQELNLDEEAVKWASRFHGFKHGNLGEGKNAIQLNENINHMTII